MNSPACVRFMRSRPASLKGSEVLRPLFTTKAPDAEVIALSCGFNGRKLRINAVTYVVPGIPRSHHQSCKVATVLQCDCGDRAPVPVRLHHVEFGSSIQQQFCRVTLSSWAPSLGQLRCVDAGHANLQQMARARRGHGIPVVHMRDRADLILAPCGQAEHKGSSKAQAHFEIVWTSAWASHSSNWRTRSRKITSFGVRLGRSNQRRNCRRFSLWDSPGCTTSTAKSVNSPGTSSVSTWARRNSAKPSAAASYRDVADTRTECSIPSGSRNETRHMLLPDTIAAYQSIRHLFAHLTQAEKSA